MPQSIRATVDFSKGSINGMVAYGAWPRLPDHTPGNPTGYELVLARQAEPEIWLRFPAGTWVLPPAAPYFVLMEGDFEVSPWPSKLSWVHTPFEGRGFAVIQILVPAGRVQVTDTCPGKTCKAWLLHEDSNIQTPVPYFSLEMLRQAPLNVAQLPGVLMPAGRVAVAVYDSSAKEFAALDVPVEIAPLKTIAVRPASPKAGHTSLILELARPSQIEQRPQDDVRVAIIAGDVRTDPTFVARTHKKILAIWRDLPSGPARLEVQSSQARLPDKELQLRSGKVEYISRNLAALPKLSVTLQIPEAIRADKRTLKVVDLSGQTPAITLTPSTDAEHMEVVVPAAPLKVTLKVGSWSVSKKVDLSSGFDSSVTLTMQAFRVTGGVYYGDKPVQAKITFNTDEAWDQSLVVETDVDGRYEALFTTPRTYIALVEVKGRGAPYADLGLVVDHDTTYDFHLPANGYHFRVTSKSDGRPVSGAEIRVANEGDTEDKIVTNQQLITDARGEATAQPLRAGRMRAFVTADGFLRSRTHEEPVSERGERWIDFELEQLGNSDTLTLLLPLGQPAAGAEVLIDPRREESWIIRADELGRVKMPAIAKNAVVLVKMGGAALKARVWSGGDQSWTLEPPASPLVLHAVHADGTPARSSPATLWLDGIRLSDGALGWLTSTPAGTDGAGYWVLRGLPSRPVEVLLWAIANHDLASKGTFDSMRVRILNPWPSQVDIKILE